MYAHISVGIYLYRSVDPIVPSAEHKSTGTAVMVTLFLLENFILDVLPNNISVFSDSADSGKILSVIKKFTFMNRMENGYMGDSFLTSILYFGIIIVVLVQLNLTYAGKHEIG